MWYFLRLGLDDEKSDCLKQREREKTREKRESEREGEKESRQRNQRNRPRHDPPHCERAECKVCAFHVQAALANAGCARECAEWGKMCRHSHAQIYGRWRAEGSPLLAVSDLVNLVRFRQHDAPAILANEKRAFCAHTSLAYQKFCEDFIRLATHPAGADMVSCAQNTCASAGGTQHN